MSDIKITQRVWLSKEDNVYIEHQVPQHQIDGIRFMYAQFKKKKPGVILNDPSGYGKTLQVVLFLNAVRRLLPAPALVLVKDGEMGVWREHFQRWTQLKDDVIFETTNPFLRKAVFVNTRVHAEKLARRSWAVAVADDDCMRVRPQADFKIWLSHVDMKENLFTFSSIYQWFYPKEVFNVKDFAVNKNDPKDVVAKAVMLDSFFEDVVIRRKDFPPFQKPEPYSALTIEPPRVSRKNKDATGTKIKRSKARIEAEATQAPKLPRLETVGRNATITSKDYFKDREMDIESFIRNEIPIGSDSIRELIYSKTIVTRQPEAVHDKHSVKINGDNDEDKLTIVEDKSDCVNDSEVNTADYQDAINEIVRNENYKENSVINESDGDKDDVQDIKNDEGKDNNIKTKTDGEGIDDEANSKKLEVSVIEESKLETIQDVVNNGSKKDLESKISELEAKTLDKFKGSLLDSIF